MAFIDQKELFERTDGGRLVIEQYYPQSIDSFRNPKRQFKCRLNEKTASASLKLMPDGVWVVTDFGGDQKARNAIQIVMLEENVEFKQAIDIIAAQFNLVGEEQRKEIYKPEIRSRAAEKDETDGQWQFATKEFTWREVETLLAPKVIEYLAAQVKTKPAEDQQDLILKEVTRIFKKYRFYSLESYTIVKDRKAITIRSTDLFPVFMFDEKDWKKIYKPREVLGSNRFMFYSPTGTASSKNYLFGYDQAKAAYDEIIKIEESDIDPDETEEDEPKKQKKISKLKHVFITSGGSDALNLAVVGQAFKPDKKEVIIENFYPVWLNSETAILERGSWDNIKRLCDSVYNIPDLDFTGKKAAHKMALEYLDVKTLYLPEELKDKSDTFRKKPMKDLRDYFKHYRVWEFFNLIKTAYPYRFWDSIPPTSKNPKWTYTVNNKHLYNFLSRNGFYRFETESEKEGYFYIQIEGNIVRKVEPKKIRDYINQFIEKRNPEVELMNTFLRTNQLNESSLSNLPFIKIDFTDFDKQTQWFFYNNIICEVTKEGIKTYKPGEVQKYVWEDEVVNRKITALPDFFTISLCSNVRTKEETLYINIHNHDCLIFRYLTNSSRIYWREELETRLEGIAGEKERAEYATLHKFTATDEPLMNGLPKAEREQYLVNHKFDIAGPLLTHTEQHEQQMQLINKIFAIGYLFHRQKEASRAWAVWGMDAKISEGDESHGGSGKSLLAMITYENQLMKTQYREGRNPKLIDNPHIYENITKHTDLLIIDDCSRYLKFDFFFSAITGPITVNPKNTKQYTVAFKESPKLWFSSNYPPHNIDPSMERRILYCIYSDYYHYNKMGEYQEERRVFDDFGKNLGSDFTEQEWNLAMNFLMQCTRFYLSCTTKINPPMDNVNKRNLKSTMGEAFEPWADVYFSEESGRLNKMVVKEDALNDYVRSTNQKNLTSQKFKKQLQAWCYYNNVELNPKEFQTSTHQIVKRVTYLDKDGNEKEGAKEMLYLRTKAAGELAIEKYNTEKSKHLKEDEEEVPI